MKKLGVILLVIAFVSCKNEADPEADKSFFTKFYDDNAFNIAYTPLDAVQTADGGYLILALKKSVDAEGNNVDPGLINIIKTDEFGEFKLQQEVPAPLGLPAPSFIELGGKFYFFCMDLTSSGIQQVEVSSDGLVNEPTTINLSYPLAAGTDGTSFLLLSFDPGARATVISKIDTDGKITSKGFSIGAADGGPYAPESIIMDHVFRKGAQLPFFVGTTGSQYYFNGIYNYTLSTLFTDLSADNPSVVIQGNQDDGGVSALYSIAGGKFAAARYNYGDNYLLPSAPLSSSIQAANLSGYLMTELVPNAPVKIINATINGQSRILYGSNTRGKQIGLYGYNPTDGTLIGTKYIGFSNSFELASMKPTVDGGLLVLGTTYIAGRFPRICLFKLSSEALGKSFQ